MPAIFYALISYVTWGTGDIFSTIISRKLGAFSMTFWGALLSLLLMSFYAPFVLSDLSKLTLLIAVVNLIMSVLFLVGWLTYAQALIDGNPSLVGSIVGAYAGITSLLSVIFFKETLSSLQVLFILTILFGIVLSTLDIKSMIRTKSVVTGKGTLLAVISMVAFAIYATFIRIPVYALGWFWPSFLIYLSFLPMLFLIARFRRITLKKPTYKNALVPMIIGTIILRTGEFTYNIAISKGLVAVVAPIAGAYITLFVPLAFFFFKEPVTKQQIVGILITICGIVALSVVSV